MTDNLPATISDADKLALMEEGARTGVETFKMSQRVVPWLRLVQAGTPYGKRSHSSYVEGCVEGDIIDTLMLKPMKEAIVVPCKYETHWTEWEARRDDSPGKMVRQWFTDASRYDGSDAGGKPPGWPRRTAEGTEINQSEVYYCLLIDPDSGLGRPVVMALASTQARKSQGWNSIIDALMFKGPNGAFNAPIYAQSYKLTSVPEKSKTNPEPYMGWVIRPNMLTLDMPNGLALWKQAQEIRAAVERGEMHNAPTVREVEGGSATFRPPAANGDGNTPPAAADNDEIPF